MYTKNAEEKKTEKKYQNNRNRYFLFGYAFKWHKILQLLQILHKFILENFEINAVEFIFSRQTQINNEPCYELLVIRRDKQSKTGIFEGQLPSARIK